MINKDELTQEDGCQCTFPRGFHEYSCPDKALDVSTEDLLRGRIIAAVDTSEFFEQAMNCGEDGNGKMEIVIYTLTGDQIRVRIG